MSNRRPHPILREKWRTYTFSLKRVSEETPYELGLWVLVKQLPALDEFPAFLKWIRDQRVDSKTFDKICAARLAVALAWPAHTPAKNKILAKPKQQNLFGKRTDVAVRRQERKVLFAKAAPAPNPGGFKARTSRVDLTANRRAI